MVPISTFITPKKSNAISVITRYDNFPAVKIGGQQKDGYSSGQALDALEETANQVLPNGYGFEFVESSAQEREASGKTVYASRSACSSYSCLWQLSMKAGRFHSLSSSGYRLASLARAWQPWHSMYITTFTSRSVS